VKPSDSPPIRYKGRTWIRVSPRRAIATMEEECRLSEKQRSRNVPFDIMPIAHATLDDLNLELFLRECLPASLPAVTVAQNGRSDEQKLSSLRFATVEAPPIPTIIGLLVTGKYSRQFIPGAYIQFLRTAAFLDDDRLEELWPDVLDNHEVINNVSIANDPNKLALLRHYRSLIPMAQEAHKPMFWLKPADGAIGAHLQAVQTAYQDFQQLATMIAERTGVKLPDA